MKIMSGRKEGREKVHDYVDLAKCSPGCSLPRTFIYTHAHLRNTFFSQRLAMHRFNTLNQSSFFSASPTIPSKLLHAASIIASNCLSWSSKNGWM